MALIWHVNFHTFQNKPVFENPEYERTVQGSILEIARREGIVLLALKFMPTHVHLITVEFPDFPLATVLKHLKGGSSIRFFESYPDCRLDLGGGHLWQVGYDKVLVTTHFQYKRTAEYVGNQKKGWVEELDGESID